MVEKTEDKKTQRSEMSASSATWTAHCLAGFIP